MIALLLALLATISGVGSHSTAASHATGLSGATAPQVKVTPSPLTAHPLAG